MSNKLKKVLDVLGAYRYYIEKCKNQFENNKYPKEIIESSDLEISTLIDNVVNQLNYNNPDFEKLINDCRIIKNKFDVFIKKDHYWEAYHYVVYRIVETVNNPVVTPKLVDCMVNYGNWKKYELEKLISEETTNSDEQEIIFGRLSGYTGSIFFNEEKIIKELIDTFNNKDYKLNQEDPNEQYLDHILAIFNTHVPIRQVE